MKILALEFSSEQRSVAVAVTRGASVEIVGWASELGGRSTRALALIEGALKQGGLEREELDCLAIGIGPGSYTGIRAAIAVAQGWQLARDIKMLGISSVETLAYTARSLGIVGDVNIAVDAQRNEFYFASYRVTGPEIQETSPLRIVATEEIKARVQRGEIVLGPDAAACGGKMIFPDAKLLAELANEREDFIPAEQLEPIYLRETAFVKAPPPRIVQ